MSQLTDVDVLGLKQGFGLDQFIETGAWMGGGIATALSLGFNRALSCDINPDFIAQCRARFDGDSRVTLLEGQSVAALSQICRVCHGPALFWLDAHFPQHYGLPEPEGSWFPLREELQAIAQHKFEYAQDVIAFDDVRVIKSLDNPRWREGEVSEYYTFSECTLSELVSPFGSTHELIVLTQAEGIGLLLPKRG